jgi:hypothetical protein
MLKRIVRWCRDGSERGGGGQGMGLQGCPSQSGSPELCAFYYGMRRRLDNL